MSEARPYGWKSKYIGWYRYLESVFGNLVPHLTDEEIMGYVSDKDWIIVPIAGEEDKRDAKLAERPNLFFDLSHEGKISFGIAYDKLNSVRRLRNILSPFNVQERDEIIQQLSTFDDSFVTKALRKTKRLYWRESPSYEDAFVQHSNKMDYEQFIELFKVVDEIMDERKLLEEGKKYQLAPSVDIISSEVRREENAFKEKLSKIKSIYEVVIKVRTEEEFEEERIQREKMEAQKKREAFRKYVDELKDKRSKNLISAEEYRSLIMEYQKKTGIHGRNRS